jgi:N-acetylneuraminic acid mutarotase
MRIHGPAARCAAALLVTSALSGCPSTDSGSTIVPADAPVARDDEASVAHRGEVFVFVLENDSDPHYEPISIATFTQPAHGTVAPPPYAPASALVYRADSGFEGVDTFTYAVASLRGRSAPATVRVTVAPNTAPFAPALTLWTPEDAPVHFGFLGSDREDPAGALDAELVGTPSHGTVTFSSTLTATYTPDPDWSGTDAFTYRVVDSEDAASEPAVVAVTISPVNDAPVIDAIGPLVTDEDVPVELTVTGSDVDSPPASLSAWVTVRPAHGTLEPLPRSGAAPSFPYRYVPARDFAGADTFTVQLHDGEMNRGFSAPLTVNVTVNPLNDPPVATPRSLVTAEDVPLTIVVTGRDADAPASALRVELVTLPDHGVVSPLSGPAPLTVTYAPPGNWSGTDRFAFRVVDPEGALSDPAEVAIEVVAANDPPLATTVAPVVTDEDVPVTFTLTGADPDDAVTALVVTIVTPPARGSLSAASGIAPLTLTYTPPAGWSGTDTVTFRVRDPSGSLSAPLTVALAVNAVNDAPVPVPDAAAACAGAPARLRVLLNDADPDGDPLAVVSASQGLHGTVALDGDAVVYTAAPGTEGTDLFTYTVSDGSATATASVTVTVSGPELLSLLPASGTTGGPLQISGRCLGLAAGAVTIGGRPAAVTTWTPRYVVATVPADFAPGLHELVVTPVAAAPVRSSYEIVPWIALVEPWYAPAGEAQALVGDAFVTPPGTVGSGGALAAVDGWTNTAIQSRMPAGGSGYLTATTSSGLTTNVVPVTAAGPDTWWTERVPAGRGDHTAVWTGTEMIVHGGNLPNGIPLATGGRYDPRHDTWLPISSATVSGGRTRHTAVWTGTEMIVWGGTSGGSVLTSTGVRYRPGTDRWGATSLVDAPSARERHSAVWTGTRMIVWGGRSDTVTGASYDPGRDAWTPISAAGAPAARYGHAAVWTGTEMIVWGGYSPAWGMGALDTGARYDPATDRWTPMSRVGAPMPRTDMAAVWTGEELVIWGGVVGSAYLGDGARYDPLTDTWRPISTAGAPAGRAAPRAVFTGRELLVWGGYDAATNLASGGRYDPVADAWAPVSELAAPTGRAGASAIWTGAELVVWGGGALDTGGRYAPATDAWAATRSGGPGAPAPRRDHAWACLPGGELVVWGGNVPGLGDVADGARYHAATGTWTPLATAGAPLPREGATAVWTGAHLLVWGGKRVSGTTTTYLGDGARWDPALDEWTALATTGAPSPRSGHTATWSGGRMVVFGGRNGAAVLATGAAYDPASDTWEALPALGAPAARQLHTAVDAGGEVIVWGGENVYATVLGTGATFHVAEWAWVALPAGPAARSRHTAVWTGDEMLIAGGAVGSQTAVPAGGRYIPHLGTWGALDTPAPIFGHGAAFTGTQLLLWGGSPAGGPLRYVPATRTWTAGAAAGAPVSRDRPSMCWTGTELVVWGGASGGAGVGGLGRWRP